MKFFKEKHSPWFLRKEDDKTDKTNRTDKEVGEEAQKGATPVYTATTEQRVNLFFNLILATSLVLLPFYFLPPIFKNLNFYFWREFLLLALAVLLVAAVTFRVFVTQKVSLLQKSTTNVLLTIAFLVFVIALFFSRSRLTSLTSLEAWVYAGWLVILFVLANNQGGLGVVGQKIGRGLLALTAGLVLIAWVLPFTPLFEKLPAPLISSLQKPRVLDLKTSWNVAIDSFKNSPLTGFGPGLYSQAFMIYKPAFFNRTENFNQIFPLTHWPFLSMLTTQGIFGVMVLVLALSSLVVGKLGDFGKKEAGVIGQKQIVLSVEAARISTAVLVALLIVTGVLLSRVFRAERFYQQVLAQLGQNQAGQAFQFLQDAINQNSYNSEYRRTYTVLSFALANSIAQNSQNRDEKGQLNAAAQQDVQNLIDVATRQAQFITENLDSVDARNWAVRGQVYRQLIGVAQGAQDWALAAYLQAVQLNPTDPYLRIELGGVYYQIGVSLKNAVDEKGNRVELPEEQTRNFLEQAAEQFRLAVVVKSDLANAYYNWAAALRELDKKNQAQAALQQTLALVEKDSPDYERVNKELMDIQEKLGIKTEENKEDLEGGKTVPQPTTVPTTIPSPTVRPTSVVTPLDTP